MGCLVWGGAKTGHSQTQYGKVRLTVRPLGIGSKTYYVHRAVWMLKHRNFTLSEAQEVSHLCGNSLCANVEHMCIEDHATNSERRHCRNQGLCTRGHSPICIL